MKSYSPYIPSTNGKNLGDHWDHIKTAVVNHTHSTLEHPAKFPEELVRIPLLATSKEDDVFLDPFSGLATTGVVAREHNRKFVGYDLNPKFVDFSLLCIV